MPKIHRWACMKKHKKKAFRISICLNVFKLPGIWFYYLIMYVYPIFLSEARIAVWLSESCLIRGFLRLLEYNALCDWMECQPWLVAETCDRSNVNAKDIVLCRLRPGSLPEKEIWARPFFWSNFHYSKTGISEALDVLRLKLIDLNASEFKT